VVDDRYGYHGRGDYDTDSEELGVIHYFKRRKGVGMFLKL
jgi:hypothetical protein